MSLNVLAMLIRLGRSRLRRRLGVRPPGLIGRKDWAKMSYDEITGTNMKEGTFYIFARDEKKPIFNEATAAPNFYPGLHLLGVIYSDE